MTNQDFVKLANKERLSNNGQWVYISATVGNNFIEYKAFDTWIQFIKSGSFKDGNGMGCNVGEFKEYLNEILNCMEAKA